MRTTPTTSWFEVKKDILEPAMPEPMQPKEALEALLKDHRGQLLKNFLERDHKAIEEQAAFLNAGSVALPGLLQDPNVRAWLREQGVQTLP